MAKKAKSRTIAVRLISMVHMTAAGSEDILSWGVHFLTLSAGHDGIL